MIRGRVVDAGTGKQIENATIQYMPDGDAAGALTGSSSAVATDRDGSYRIVVPAGKGRLFINGPTLDYVADGVESNHAGDPQGTQYHASRILNYDVGYGDDPVEINAELRRGRIARGQVVGPEGTAVDENTFVALLQYQSYDLINEGLQTHTLRDGRFELFGIEPNKPARVIFLDAAYNWGRLVDISRRPEEGLTIRLQPCGEAKAVFVGPNGKPVPNYTPYLTLLVSSSPEEAVRQDLTRKKSAQNWMYVGRIDKKNYRPSSVWLTDEDGRMVFPALIPGLVYRLVDPSQYDADDPSSRIRRYFTLKPGEKLDLGEILVAKPLPLR